VYPTLKPDTESNVDTSREYGREKDTYEKGGCQKAGPKFTIKREREPNIQTGELGHGKRPIVTLNA